VKVKQSNMKASAFYSCFSVQQVSFLFTNVNFAVSTTYGIA